MKIFISWSGDTSHQVALLLRDWLKDIFPGVMPFVSSEDLRKGKLWGVGLAKELSETNFGISCLTPSNLESPWLIFEAGALSKVLEEGQVCTLLLAGLKYTDITGPLEKFQNTKFEHDDVRRLVGDINERLVDGKRPTESLDRVYEKFWPDLQNGVSGIVEKALKPDKTTKTRRSAEEILSEILERTRSIESSIPSLQLKPSVESSLVMSAYNVDDPHVVTEYAQIYGLWHKVTEAVRKQKPFNLAWMRAPAPTAIVHGYFILVFSDTDYKIAESLQRPKFIQFISDMLTMHYGRPLKPFMLIEDRDIPF